MPKLIQSNRGYNHEDVKLITEGEETTKKTNTHMFYEDYDASVPQFAAGLVLCLAISSLSEERRDRVTTASVHNVHVQVN